MARVGAICCGLLRSVDRSVRLMVSWACALVVLGRVVHNNMMMWLDGGGAMEVVVTVGWKIGW